jgi:hypothetical protein
MVKKLGPRYQKFVKLKLELLTPRKIIEKNYILLRLFIFLIFLE